MKLETEKKRADLRAVLADMEAVKPWCDPSNEAAEPFGLLFNQLRHRALALAADYAKALQWDDQP